MLYRTSKPYQGFTIIKKYGLRYKVIQGTFKIGGYDKDEKIQENKDNQISCLQDKEVATKNSFDFKLSQSLSRSRQKIFELIECNSFTYFCTFTLNPDKYDRNNLDKFIKDFSQYIRDLRKKYNYDIKYLFIPELHKNGGWHLHGVMDLPIDCLSRFNKDDKLPKYIIDHIDTLYNFVGYQNKFGYCVLESIREKSRVASYITKYITKDLAKGIDKNKKCFFHSRKLKTAETIYKGLPLLINTDYDFKGDYVSIKWCDTLEDLNNLFEGVESVCFT